MKRNKEINRISFIHIKIYNTSIPRETKNFKSQLFKDLFLCFENSVRLLNKQDRLALSLTKRPKFHILTFQPLTKRKSNTTQTSP